MHIRSTTQDDIKLQQARCTSKPVASIISKQKYDRVNYTLTKVRGL